MTNVVNLDSYRQKPTAETPDETSPRLTFSQRESDGQHVVTLDGYYHVHGSSKDAAVNNLAVFMSTEHPDAWEDGGAREQVEAYFAARA